MRNLVHVAGLSAIAVLVPSFLAVAVPAPGGTVATAGPHAASGLATHPPAGSVRVVEDTWKSTNWSGYAVTAGSKFTDVKGTWVEPRATCTMSRATDASFWVGIDGYTSASVEQLGSALDCSKARRASYSAWYEMYPAGGVNLPPSKYPVKPGDTLTAEVSVSGTSFTLSLGSSAGWMFSITKKGAGLKQDSAEWIAEAPEICDPDCATAKLADFGEVAFSEAEAATGGPDQPISAFTSNKGPHALVMTVSKSNDTVRARPGAISPAGSGFTDVWKHD